LLALVVWLTNTPPFTVDLAGQSPEVLRARSRDIIKKFGYTQPALDSAEGVLLKTDYLAYITTNDNQQIAERLRTEGPGAYRFCIRVAALLRDARRH